MENPDNDHFRESGDDDQEESDSIDDPGEYDPIAELYGADPDEAPGFHDLIWGSTVDLSAASMVGMSAQVTSAHEDAHKYLNDSTEYGIMLKAAALLHSRQVDNPKYEAIVGRLRRSSRNVHEGYATFASVCDVALGDKAVLIGSPEYLTWFENFSTLVPAPDHWRLKHISAGVVAEMCMRVPCLQYLIDGGIDREESWHVSFDKTPDRRFAELHALASSTFWYGVLQECRSRMSAEQVRIFCPEEPERQSFDFTYSPDHDDLVSELYLVISSHLQALMERHGMAAPSLNRAAAVALLERLAPSALDPAIFERGAGLEPEVSVVDSYFQHNIVLRPTKVSARLLSLREHVDLVAPFTFDERDEPGICHVLVGLGQYFGRRFSLPTHQALWLFAHADETFAVALGVPDSDGTHTLLLADSSDQVVEAVNTLDNSVRLNVSVASSSMVPRLHDKWRPLLEGCDHKSILQDFSLGQLLAAFKKGNERVTYWRNVMKVGPGRGISVVVIKTDRITAPNIIICTKTQSKVLENYFDYHYPDATDATGDAAFALDEDSIRLGFLINLETLHAVKYPWITALPETDNS
uniref:hypothetical protein n=1 Tax=Paractinoplanes polyasparticus TaxID=2856853 RepID=UPI001C8599AD|nr:hypothetical protein [Actinoplanes polyasparticus]